MSILPTKSFCSPWCRYIAEADIGGKSMGIYYCYLFQQHLPRAPLLNPQPVRVEACTYVDLMNRAFFDVVIMINPEGYR